MHSIQRIKLSKHLTLDLQLRLTVCNQCNTHTHKPPQFAFQSLRRIREISWESLWHRINLYRWHVWDLEKRNFDKYFQILPCKSIHHFQFKNVWINFAMVHFVSSFHFIIFPHVYTNFNFFQFNLDVQDITPFKTRNSLKAFPFY